MQRKGSRINLSGVDGNNLHFQLKFEMLKKNEARIWNKDE